jgi:YD repeat-containing protein
MRRYILSGCALVALVGPTAAAASETINYSYDARGRLAQVAHTGTVNNGVTTSYAYDKAHNRTSKTTSGSPNPPPP